ncbi:unnamed protein product [Lota lota]
MNPDSVGIGGRRGHPLETLFPSPNRTCVGLSRRSRSAPVHHLDPAHRVDKDIGAVREYQGDQSDHGALGHSLLRSSPEDKHGTSLPSRL